MCLRQGDIRYLAGKGHLLAFARSTPGEQVLAAFNTGSECETLELQPGERVRLLLGSARSQLTREGHTLTLPPHSASLLLLYPEGAEGAPDPEPQP